MLTDKKIDIICIVVLAVTIIITVLFMFGESFGLVAVVDEDAESYEDDVNFTSNDYNGTWDTSDATVITLDGDEITISGSGAYLYNESVVISNGGEYVISGSLSNGSIIVDAYDSSKVWIMLDGVDINCDDDACFRIDNADKVFLTLAEGSENSFTSGSDYSSEAVSDGTGGTIYAHDDLTINGSGDLNIVANYKHGIEANDDLVITGGTITIESVQDGINVNDAFKMAAGSVNITAGDDGISAGEEIIIADGSITINECYEGLEGLTIDISGGDVTIYSSDDGINANGNIESGFGMMGGGPGGMESGDSGDNTEDDTSDEDDDSDTWVHISGGTVTIINASGTDADGIDSNGDIIISGGYVFVSVGNTGGNCALDYGSEADGELIINGGTVIAAGSSSMLEEVSDSSGQCSVVWVLDDTAEADSVFTLTDSSGNVILEETVPATYSAVIFSSPDMEQGQTYDVKAGDETASITLSDTVTSEGSVGGMGGGMGGGGGRRGMQNQSSGDAMMQQDQNGSSGDMMQQAQGGSPDDMMQDMTNATVSEVAEMYGLESSDVAEYLGVDEDEVDEVMDMTVEEAVSGDASSVLGMDGGMMEESGDASGDSSYYTPTVSDWIAVGASAVILIAGVGFSYYFKRRR